MKTRFFTTNLGLKLASLVLAVILWFFVILSGRSQITVSVPLVFRNLPAGLAVVDSPETVSITIQGQERLIRNLRQDEISAVVDLGKAKTGKFFYTLSKDNIKLPKTLIVTDIDPETVSLKIEAQLKKTVSVKPAVVGLPEKGFAIVDITVVPDSVVLEGPKSMVKKIRTVKTEPIDTNGINSNLRYKANLNITNPNIKKNINKVEVRISVRQIR